MKVKLEMQEGLPEDLSIQGSAGMKHGGCGSALHSTKWQYGLTHCDMGWG